MNRRRGKKLAAGGSGQVRIIGGCWRGRKLPVVAVSGLRPTGDRARETLFNWLTPALPGAVCLDLFAGTGVLGLEALSRGAASCALVESDARAATALAESIEKLAARTARLHQGNALDWLDRCSETFDLVFVDPPYSLGIWQNVAEKLVPLLKPRALVYFETPADQALSLPAGFELTRDKSTPMTRLRLFRWGGNL